MVVPSFLRRVVRRGQPLAEADPVKDLDHLVGTVWRYQERDGLPDHLLCLTFAHVPAPEAVVTDQLSYSYTN